MLGAPAPGAAGVATEDAGAARFAKQFDLAAAFTVLPVAGVVVLLLRLQQNLWRGLTGAMVFAAPHS